MFMLSSLRARKLCTLSESCVLTAWTTSRCRQFTDLSSSPSWHVSSDWWGFASISDLQRLEAFIRRSDRCSFVPANLPTFADLCENVDEKLFNTIISDCNHILHYLLPLSLKNLNTTTYGNVHTTSRSTLELVISLTRTTFNSYCTSTRISCLTYLLVHCFNFYPYFSLYSRCVLSAVLINKDCIVL